MAILNPSYVENDLQIYEINISTHASFRGSRGLVTDRPEGPPGRETGPGASLWRVPPGLWARTPGGDPQPLGRPGAALRLFELLSLTEVLIRRL